MIQKITLIGAGNLATQLGKAFKKAGLEIQQVYSRTESSANELARLLDCAYTNQISDINLAVDLVVIAVKDDAIGEVLSGINCSNTLIVHTAGSVPMSLLEKHSSQFGVFYPLQTFSKQRDVDFSDIPICLEANSESVFNQLSELASVISSNVSKISSEERKILHLAAVFACNFVNHFYFLGDQLLAKHQLDFSLLKPLIKETAEKVMEIRPFDAQTGPAKRFDETIINKHLKLLDNQTELRKIYSFVTESIFEAHQKELK